MTKITDNINELRDCMVILDNLKDKEYLEANWITEEEIPVIVEEINNEIKKREKELDDYMNWLSRSRQTNKIQLDWLLVEKERIENLIKTFQNIIERTDRRMAYLMTQLSKEKYDTSLYKLSFRKSESVEITNEELLPKDYITVKTVEQPNKTAIKEELKNWVDVPWASIKVNQNLQVK